MSFNIDAPPTEEHESAAAQRAKAVIIRKLEWLERLAANEDFRQFKAAFDGEMAIARSVAGAIMKYDAATRDAANQRLMAIQDVISFVEKEIAIQRATLQAPNAPR